MFQDIIDENVLVATYIKVNQLRYDSFSQKYQGTSGQVPIVVNDIFFLFSLTLALVFLLLAEYYWECMVKEPAIRNSYQFPNVSSHEWHS